MTSIDSTSDLVSQVYDTMRSRIESVRSNISRPLTLSEKLLYGHLVNTKQDLVPGASYLQLTPDRVAMQDATAQMAALQFMLANKDKVSVPTTVHCDHLIRAHTGADSDLKTAQRENDEVYDFLKSVSQRYGMGFWAPGSGIIHQVLFENYAFPGGLLIGTDSHTPNAGGLGMLAIGVGGADAADVMVGFPWEVLAPKLIGIRLTGNLDGWASPKDVILKVAGILSAKGGTNHIVEYFGPGTDSIAATGKGTITNMGAELGATTSIFPYDQAMGRYLRSTSRSDIADLADSSLDLLTPDPEVQDSPDEFFDRIIEIDLSSLEPHVVGPHRPDLARPLSEFRKDVVEQGYPDQLSAALIGSCTNSSYQDITRAAAVAEQAINNDTSSRVPFLVTPGSEMIRATIQRDGQLGTLEKVGGTVLANACGPCIGQWQRDDFASSDNADSQTSSRNSIVTSYNRNFPRRNDGNPDTLAFIVSPEIAVAYALGGKLSFNPVTDELQGANGAFTLEPPAPAQDIPENGYIGRAHGFIEPNSEGTGEVQISKHSKRLERLNPFGERHPDEYFKMPVLLKADGPCTTDHISAAGPWLRYRGHLDNISDNMFLGANNCFATSPGNGFNSITGEEEQSIPKIARSWKDQSRSWVAIGDDNYGEGSSREHAAMSPRLLGAAAIIARSFARIAESNLKKQGILPLTFDNADDYNLIQKDDRITIVEIADISPSTSLQASIEHSDGSADLITLSHTLNKDQLEWFWAGSAINVIRKSRASG